MTETGWSEPLGWRHLGQGTQSSRLTRCSVCVRCVHPGKCDAMRGGGRVACAQMHPMRPDRTSSGVTNAAAAGRGRCGVHRRRVGGRRNWDANGCTLLCVCPCSSAEGILLFACGDASDFEVGRFAISTYHPNHPTPLPP